jgi:GT2 family glycosyltransferase
VTTREFSIVIATYNRPMQILNALRAIAALRFPRELFEVIVVDDGGEEPLDDRVTPYRSSLNLTLLRQTNRGPGRARNSGARVASGRHLVFTDDDCLFAEDYLERMREAVAQWPTSMLGGRTLNALPSNLFSSTSQMIVDLVYRFYNPIPERATFFTTNNMVLPADQFRQIGGFDEMFFRAASEDRELCDRWRHAQLEMRFVPTAIVHHAHDLTLTSFCRQHFTYGRGAWRYHRRRAARGTGRLRHDIRLHARMLSLLRQPLAATPAARRLSVCGALGLWQVANAGGFCSEALLQMVRPSRDARDEPSDAIRNSVETTSRQG